MQCCTLWTQHARIDSTTPEAPWVCPLAQPLRLTLSLFPLFDFSFFPSFHSHSSLLPFLTPLPSSVAGFLATLACCAVLCSVLSFPGSAEKVLRHEDLMGAPVLVMANKQARALPCTPAHCPYTCLIFHGGLFQNPQHVCALLLAQHMHLTKRTWSSRWCCFIPAGAARVQQESHPSPPVGLVCDATGLAGGSEIGGPGKAIGVHRRQGPAVAGQGSVCLRRVSEPLSNMCASGR